MAATDATNWDAILAESRCLVQHRRNRCMLQDLRVRSVAYDFLMPVGTAYPYRSAGSADWRAGVQIRPTVSPRPDCKTILTEGVR